MVSTSESPARSSRERTIAGLLRTTWERQHQRDSKLSQRELAKRCGVSHVTIGRWLSGETRVSLENTVTVLTAMGIVGDEREDILKIARGEDDQPWVTSGPPGTYQQLTGSMEMEATAASMFEWSPLVVPGLLQTESYARSIIGANAKLTPVEVNHLVTLRLGRQHAIRREAPIRLTAILGLPAIQGGIGGPKVMASQLRHLLKVSTDAAAVTLLVARVDGGWHGGLLGTFVLYEFDKLPSIVSLEHHRTGSFVDYPEDVAAYTELAADLRERAYTPDETRDLLQQEIATKETT
jgi:transcriptional regulator with XRE-family HTH domain